MTSSSSLKVLFITLRTFSLTGGVEKVCRGIGHSLQQLHNDGQITFKMLSLYDHSADEKYVKADNFEGYKGRRVFGMLNAIKTGLTYDIVILSHINLSAIGYAIKLARPSSRLILWTHGIEVWRPLSKIQKLFLKQADKIISVSNFTASDLQNRHSVERRKIQVLSNALDPYFQIPDLTNVQLRRKSDKIRAKYGLHKDQKIWMALTRLRSTEKSKNYDLVIELLGELRLEGKDVIYILCGKHDQEECSRLNEIIRKAGMQDRIILTGYISDEDLSAHYLLADAFVLPSVKEGFGLVFMEAQACGLPVLAGNQDGSVDAVKNPDAGLLVSPYNKKELKNALCSFYSKELSHEERIKIQQECIKDFSYSSYFTQIRDLVEVQEAHLQQ